MPDISDLVEDAVSYQDSQVRQALGHNSETAPAVQRLQQTIMGLEKGISDGGQFIKHVRYPRTLVKALKELEVLIGNDSIKGDVADSVNNIIMNKLLNEQNPNIKLEESMLNIALYGPPGVGKTTIGAKLAKIVYALGYLNDHRGPDGKERPNLEDFMAEEKADPSAEWISMVIVIFYVVMIVLAIVSSGKSAVSGMSWTSIAVLAASLIFIIAIIAYVFWPKSKHHTPKKHPKHNVDLKIDQNETHSAEGASGTGAGGAVGEGGEGKGSALPMEPEIADDDLLTVVTRTDLVSRYMGNSDKDTLQVLQRNMGKVLFIDEAYQLYDNESAGGDKYGMEVLNVINQFLSEHPKDIVVIFAGYRDKMYDTIFKANAGLERRVMWHFDCKGYSGDELYQILEFMCKRKGWEFRAPEEVRNLIVNYTDLFRNYGGDMEKVGFNSRSAYNSEMIDPSIVEKPVPGILETRHVMSGIKKLQENSQNAAGGRVRQEAPQMNRDQLAAMLNMMQPQRGAPEEELML